MDAYNSDSPELPVPTTIATESILLDPGHSSEPNHPVMDDASAASHLFDWGELLEFTYDDQFIEPFSPAPAPQPPPPPLPFSPVASDRVRKRDPRLICENFLAGRVPCACPEMDERLAELEEEEAGGPGKKRTRTARIGAGKARCQVPGCEVDISELKGYHKRHRVCLSCATAASVLIDGESRRYCQQCGKFHILTDFDEEKRSCRRKLKWHNDRRRRKHTTGSKDSPEKKSLETLLDDDTSGDVEAGKGSENVSLSNQSAEKEELFEFEDGNNSNQCSAPASQAVQSDSAVSFGASEGGKDNSKCGLSPTFGDNKSAYASSCPTGRISFKLYDWNPAEFPRRLRHQIFQWLASMPVELEGYIRPGCIILTVFVAMPNFMWVKLFEDPVSYLKDFITAPGRPLSGKGTAIVYLNHMRFQMLTDRTSLEKVDVKVRAPRLSYVHPTCFEAGKAMEFVACGSNLLQPKFRFLISFAGKYLTHESYVSLACHESGVESSGLEYQVYKIYVPSIESNLSGPAFIEVENESGLSNFIPILIGSKEICSEMEILQQHHESLVLSNSSGFTTGLSEFSITKQTPLSEFILDVGWLLKEPAMETIQKPLSSSQIQRYNYMLGFLMCVGSTVILERVLQSLKGTMSNAQMDSAVDSVYDCDMRLLQENFDKANNILHQKRRGLGLQSKCFVEEENIVSQKRSEDDMLSVFPGHCEDMEIGGNWRSHIEVGSVCPVEGSIVPLLGGEFVNSNSIKKSQKRSGSLIISRTGTVLNSRPAVFLIAVTIICLVVCAVILHPSKVSGFAVTIRRCLFND